MFLNPTAKDFFLTKTYNFLCIKCLINKDNYYIKQYVKTGDHNILKKHVLELAKVPGQIWETSRVAFDTTGSPPIMQIL